MATNHTTNYQLNLWEPSDTFTRTEFNENTSKIEAALVSHDAAIAQKADAGTVTAALAQKADASALAALAQTVAAKGNCRIEVGTYMGTGTYGTSNRTTITFSPNPVFVLIDGGGRASLVYGQTHYIGYDAYGTYGECTAVWTETSLSLCSNHSPNSQLNRQNASYTYIAFYIL